MPKPTRISIITPSYNQAAYLEDTILSVLNQDYPNLEYILIDGGSTDGSLEIIAQYADKFTYSVSEPDKGQADAINKGFAQASGEIVAWLNSDDVYLPGTLDKVAQAFQADPALGVIYGDLQSIDHAGKLFNTITYAQYTLADLLALRIIGQPSVFFRRSVLKQAGMLDLSYRYLLDHQLWLRMAGLTTMRYIPGPLAAARHHAAAKNVAEAAEFGEEVYRILAWAGKQTELNDIICANPGRVWGGAHRLNARYLLEGGEAAHALKYYAKAFWQAPLFTLRHAHRILFALLSLVGLGWLRKGVGR